MLAHHPRLESITLHFLALILTFSAFSLAYLSASTTNLPVNSNLQVRPIYASGPTGFTWQQTSWTSANTSIFSVTWGTNSNWTNYSTATGVSFGSTGMTINPSGSIESSIMNLGDQKHWIIIPNALDNPVISQRNATSAGAVASATWKDWGNPDLCNLNQTFTQYRISNSSASPITIADVTLYADYFLIKGTVKNASTNSTLSGVTVGFSGNSGVTDNNGNYTLESPYNGTTLDITASKAGFVSQNKTASVASDWCTLSSIQNLDFSLSPASPSATPPPPTTVPPTTKTSSSPTPVIAIPSSLAASAQPTSTPNVVTNFTVQTKDGNKIVFLEPIDLSAPDVKNVLSTLDNFIKVSAPNTVSLDSQTLPSLNKMAAITMPNLTFTSVPEILVNGKKDTQGVVSNIVYDQKTGTLSFNVAHFTTFSAVPKLEITTPTTTVSEASTVVLGKISDPKAKVTGKFNGVTISKIVVSPNGNFLIKGLTFKPGANSLSLEAQSSLGTVLPLNTTLTYNPKVSATAVSSKPDQTLLLLVSLTVLLLALLLGYLLIRRRLFNKAALDQHPSLNPQPRN